MNTLTLTMTEHEAAYIHWLLYTRVMGSGEARDNINSVMDALHPIAIAWDKNEAMRYSGLDAELINVENWLLEGRNDTTVPIHTRLAAAYKEEM